MLKDFLLFLSSLHLDAKLAKTRTLEADLKGPLNPSLLLNRLFFEHHHWLGFEAFYRLYLEENGSRLTQRFPEITEQSLLEGLRARLYRTQCGILTEYQAYLAAQVVFGEENVSRSLALDRQGVDFSIRGEGQLYHIHIFVDSPRAWHYRRLKSAQKKVDQLEGIHVDLPYALKQGKINSLHFLPNGFGVYT
ncbi:MAG: TaqI family restriction endonuclease, partial [Cyclobacteriaceae bacterium]